MASEKKEAAACPLCGGPNGCAIEAGQQAESCWCMRRAIGERVLERVPPPLRGRVCVCRACAERGRGASI
ncbi:cysteine-rich CWC family protein [Cohnella sp. JJ-181]|uniref:cysteine-rich CWC family protein n=1 Tax=Cohnella rhizoplanae TaxID=2974897 RepID=UPI0022FF6529|nr:cysteine-rich CWC family protein [Cohnella sp. JJ-181]CAI6083435.1 hypothetical protein COHCIP112018_03995 [Cohnella sp. JJ-181]